jgi:hypothetical protein
MVARMESNSNYYSDQTTTVGDYWYQVPDSNWHQYYVWTQPAQTGWICGRCGSSNAPWVPKCDCKEGKTYTTTRSCSCGCHEEDE